MDYPVTGGAGVIGSNLVDALVARGDGVTVIDSLPTGSGLYGDTVVRPTPENYPLRPLASDGESKYAAEPRVELRDGRKQILEGL